MQSNIQKSVTSPRPEKKVHQAQPGPKFFCTLRIKPERLAIRGDISRRCPSSLANMGHYCEEEREGPTQECCAHSCADSLTALTWPGSTGRFSKLCTRSESTQTLALPPPSLSERVCVCVCVCVCLRARTRHCVCNVGKEKDVYTCILTHVLHVYESVMWHRLNVVISAGKAQHFALGNDLSLFIHIFYPF